MSFSEVLVSLDSEEIYYFYVVPYGVVFVQASGSKRTAMGEAAADRALSHLPDVREFIRNSVSTHVNELVSIFHKVRTYFHCSLDCSTLGDDVICTTQIWPLLGFLHTRL